MLFDCKCDKQVFDCLVSADRYGKESRRGHQSKAKYKQSGKPRLGNDDLKQQKKEVKVPRWIRKNIGEDAINLAYDAIVQKLEEEGIELSVNWRYKRPVATYKIKDEELLELFIEKGSYKPVLREALGL